MMKTLQKVVVEQEGYKFKCTKKAEYLKPEMRVMSY